MIDLTSESAAWWRARSRSVIDDVVAASTSLSPKQVRKRLRAAFRETIYNDKILFQLSNGTTKVRYDGPYTRKIWRDNVKRAFSVERIVKIEDRRQLSLFA